MIMITLLTVPFAGGSAGGACLYPFADDFNDGTLAPLWTVSGPCGSATETGGVFSFTKTSGCVGFITARFSPGEVLCGDFDLEIDYTLAFPAASTAGGSIHGLQLLRASDLTLVGGIERYRQGSSSCVWPIADSYKSYTGIPGCPPDAVYTSTTHVGGRFRIARSGSTLTTFYWDGAWVTHMARSITTADLLLRLNSGTNGSHSAGHTGTFDNLTVWTSLPVSVRSVAWGAIKTWFK
jgi:hypothetical protein